jgi:CheY-like chemotaxis protein
MQKIARRANVSTHPATPTHPREDRFAPEYVRVARALIGVTPAQLAAHIGARPDLSTADGASDPAKTPERLAVALRSVIGWYEARFSTAPRPTDGTGTERAEPLDDLVRRYIGLRAEWESGEAVRMVAGLGASDDGVAAARRAEPEARAMAAPATAPIPRRRALLVDDASDVVVTVGAFLESLGFDVVHASNGDAALRFLVDGTRLDLLVTDHAMPGMTGRDLAEQACQQNPALHVLIITGYPDAEELATLPPGVFLLAKPFRRAELSLCIHRLFGATQPARESRSTMMARAEE